MSIFWQYFNKLNWPLFHKPGALQAVGLGLAKHLDSAKDDLGYLRDQFFPELCDSSLMLVHGQARGLIKQNFEAEEQFRQRVLRAYAWHLLGGKALGLPEILKFYGYPIGKIENMRKTAPLRWAEFSLELCNLDDAVYSDITGYINTLRWLVNEYKPARSRLFRIYNEYDARHWIWTKQSKWSTHYWSYMSGVNLGDLIVSLGRKHKIYAGLEEEIKAEFGMAATYGSYARLIRDTWIWSLARWSETFIRRHGFSISVLLTSEAVRAELPWHFRWRSLARAELTWSGADKKVGTWGDINCRWGLPYYWILNDPNLWGQNNWGDLQNHTLVITPEKFSKKHILGTTDLLPKSAIYNLHTIHSLQAKASLGFIWSHTPWSEKISRRHGFSGSSDSMSLAIRAKAPFRFRSRLVSRTELTWSGASKGLGAKGTWGDINCRWGNPAQVITGDIPKWSNFYWGDKPKRQLEVQTEMFEIKNSSYALMLIASQALSGQEATVLSLARTYPLNYWTGVWDNRHWSPFKVETAVKTSLLDKYCEETVFLTIL